jgi:hypothetical protein
MAGEIVIKSQKAKRGEGMTTGPCSCTRGPTFGFYLLQSSLFGARHSLNANRAQKDSH